MPELQANRCCVNCKQPYTPADLSGVHGGGLTVFQVQAGLFKRCADSCTSAQRSKVMFVAGAPKKTVVIIDNTALSQAVAARRVLQ